MNKLCKQCGETAHGSFYDHVKSKCKPCYIEHYKKKYLEQRDKKIEYQKEWNNKNRRKRAEYKAKEYTARSLAKRKGLSAEDRNWMTAIYKSCVEVTACTGVLHHVDHVLPIRSKEVCGLHVPWNLQIIPAEENIHKGNKLILDESLALGRE
jgi:hypothetical protein